MVRLFVGLVVVAVGAAESALTVPQNLDYVMGVALSCLSYLCVALLATKGNKSEHKRYIQCSLNTRW